MSVLISKLDQSCAFNLIWDMSNLSLLLEAKNARHIDNCQACVPCCISPYVFETKTANNSTLLLMGCTNYYSNK